jgi:hypothetical protein
MSVIAAEIIIVLLLIAANGLFAMAEFAIVSARKTRLRKLADQGDPRARVALELSEESRSSEFSRAHLAARRLRERLPARCSRFPSLLSTVKPSASASWWWFSRL